MPKFIVTSGSHFQPFTYDEMVKPLMQMAEAQNSAQDAYDLLSMETAALEDYLTENEDDAMARGLYNNYRQRLESLQNNLWGNGYTPQTRRDLALARTGYAQDIKGKLQNNIERRQAQSKAYWDMKHANPDMVMGRDPGSFGLDNYIQDPNFGNNWFAYSAKQFESEVGAEVEARAKGMLADLQDPNNVKKNPRLEAILTRVINQGVTNQETVLANAVVDDVYQLDENARRQYYLEHSTPDAVVIMSEALINRYNATGINDSDVIPSERKRLLDRGKAGFAKGVMQPKVDDIKDPEFELQMAIRKAQAESDIDFNNYKRKKIWDAEQAAATAQADFMSWYDTYTEQLSGPNAKKAMDATEDYDITPGPVVRGTNGAEAHNKVEASDLVFMEQDAIDAYDKLGFDYRLNPTTWMGKATPSSKYLQGEITVQTEDGPKVYETRYAPYAKVRGRNGEGYVQYREKGSDGKFKVSIPLTDYYNEKRKAYEDNVRYYQEKEKKIYDMAVINPEKRAKDYAEQGIDFKTPLSDFRSEVMHKSENATYDATRVYFGRKGTDKGEYADMLTSYLESGLELGSSLFDRGSIKKDPKRRSYTGTGSYIHKITEHNTLEKKAADPDDAFDIDKGKISNVNGVEITPEGLLEGYISGEPYIVFHTSRGRYAVGVKMLQSNGIEGIFRNLIQQGVRDANGTQVMPSVAQIIEDDRISEPAKDAMLKAMAVRATSEMRMFMNQVITQSRGGTNKDDQN